MYDIESVYVASSVKDAIEVLEKNPKAEIISGGTDVLIKIREGKMAGCNLVNISNISELKGITMEKDKTIVIKAGTVFSHITNNHIIKKYIPNLGDAVDKVGGPQIRNMGTIGGNICNGVTSADSASTLCTLDAKLELTGPNGIRIVPITKWYAGPGKTIREHNEILTSIRIEKENYEGYVGHYIKYGKRKAMEIATLGCSVMTKLTEDKKSIDTIKIGYGVAGPVPMRCFDAEKAAKGKSLTDSLIEELCKIILKEVNPRSSWRASKEFRLQLVEEMFRRAFIETITAGGGVLNA